MFLLSIICTILPILMVLFQIFILVKIENEFLEISRIIKKQEEEELKKIERAKALENEEVQKASVEISREADAFIDRYLKDNHQ